MQGQWQRVTEQTKSVVRKLARMHADLTALGVQRMARTSDGPQTPTPEPEEAPLSRLFQTLDMFPALVGYIQGRRREPFLVLEDKAAVQDLLYLSLKPVLPELVYEEPTRKGAAGFSVGDFSLTSMKLILEVKFVKVAADVKVKANEIAQDIWQYSAQTDCQTIIFFVYDPHILIPRPPEFHQQDIGRVRVARAAGQPTHSDQALAGWLHRGGEGWQSH